MDANFELREVVDDHGNQVFCDSPHVKKSLHDMRERVRLAYIDEESKEEDTDEQV